MEVSDNGNQQSDGDRQSGADPVVRTLPIGTERGEFLAGDDRRFTDRNGAKQSGRNGSE